MLRFSFFLFFVYGEKKIIVFSFSFSRIKFSLIVILSSRIKKEVIKGNLQGTVKFSFCITLKRTGFLISFISGLHRISPSQNGNEPHLNDLVNERNVVAISILVI